MSQTKPTFNAKTTSCAVPLPTGKCVQPMATNKEDSEMQFSVVMNGNTHTIITDTPYGTTIFFPLTKKIMRHCSIIDGDVHVFIQYVQWLQCQWTERNPFIDCYEV